MAPSARGQIDMFSKINASNVAAQFYPDDELYAAINVEQEDNENLKLSTDESNALLKQIRARKCASLANTYQVVLQFLVSNHKVSETQAANADEIVREFMKCNPKIMFECTKRLNRPRTAKHKIENRVVLMTTLDNFQDQKFPTDKRSSCTTPVPQS